MKIKKTNEEIALTRQIKPPKSWVFDEETGDFSADGFVSDVWDLQHPETNHHFLLHSEKPIFNASSLVKKDGGVISRNARGGVQRHIRLFHIWDNGQDVSSVINQLVDANEARQRVVIAGKIVPFYSTDPEMQHIFFERFDDTCRCPVVQINSITIAPEPPSIFSKLALALALRF
jgi:hypothetical protein